MAENEQDQKTEQPTEKHLSDAMDRGQFAKSAEMNLAFILAAALGVLSLTGPSAAREISTFSVNIFAQLGSVNLTIDTATSQIGSVVFTLGRVLLPMVLACAGAALLSGSIQSGFELTPKAFGLHWESLDVVAGFRRLFTKDILVHCCLDLLKLLGVTAALYGGVKAVVNDPLFHAPVETVYLGQFIFHATLSFLGRLMLALGVIAAVSYAYELFRNRQKMMMSRQEVKD